MWSFKGTNGAPKSRYYVLCRRNAGLPTGGDPYGNGALVVVRAGESPVHGEGGQVSSTKPDRKVLVMRTAETVLNVIRERGERGLPLEDIYRQLYNRNLYLRAYGHLYSNQGAMTKGITAETVDGMSLAKIDQLIDALRYEQFRWTPVRRVNIPKPNGTTRPLGIPTWTDKLLQEVLRMILEAYYEAAVFRPLPRLPARTGLSHRSQQRDGNLDRHPLVHRGRHQGVLRQHRPRRPVVSTRRETPRWPLSAPAQVPTESRLP